MWVDSLVRRLKVALIRNGMGIICLFSTVAYYSWTMLLNLFELRFLIKLNTLIICIIYILGKRGVTVTTKVTLEILAAEDNILWWKLTDNQPQKQNSSHHRTLAPYCNYHKHYACGDKTSYSNTIRGKDKQVCNQNMK